MEILKADNVFTVFLMGVLVFQELLHFKERRDLYNRLMARTLTEYSTHAIEEAKFKIPDRPEKRPVVHI